MRTTLLSILILTLISCDATTKEFIGSSWVVSELTENNTDIPVTNDVILTIKSNTEFTLKLDANNCFGSYTISNDGKIKLSDLACTEICCDSKFSMAVARALSKVSKIKLDKDRATLSGDNVQIKFKKYELTASKIKMMNDDGKKFVKGEKSTSIDGMDIGVITRQDKNQQSNVDLPKGESITLYKSPCKGTCEEFTMIMYADGTVYYTGKYNAKIQGKRIVKLMPSKSESLFRQFEEANFKNFQDKYDDERIMDIQNTYLTYKGKKIEIRYQPNAPEKLKILLAKVEERAKEVLAELKK
ncbi:DUF6438 domain-containing protein [uncultured Kordia sp.]|uniref:DUF6438 domain-containing protein n=1 Tax=uncultured Kordia sp. TaxID=507699 RepID=UPI00260CFED6|nr:DUF6438 domain-containing protein [uncultured Kordia sp.]